MFLSVNSKSYRDNVEKLSGQPVGTGSVQVLTNMKMQFVQAVAKVPATKQWRIRPAVGVGLGRTHGHGFAAGIDFEELDVDSGCRAAAAGIQYVSCQFAHQSPKYRRKFPVYPILFEICMCPCTGRSIRNWQPDARKTGISACGDLPE